MLDKVDTGFLKGTIFTNLYEGYKDYKISNLEVNNKKDELLTKIMMLSFALNDLNLYLDLHPQDKKYLNHFNNLEKMLNELERMYIDTYGPLEKDDKEYTNKFNWIDNPWPWDNEDGVKYV